MHIHILGICGTFMAGLAQLARATGHTVSGSDQNVYPPMSDFLAAASIEVLSGWTESHLRPRPDLVVIGNALSRGNPLVEYVLANRIPYTSGAQWLAEHVLAGQHVIAIAGTHGKTTTTSLVAWMLESAGYSPGFLIGGIPQNFGYPAQMGGGRYFVLEADEYDTAFFDKRSKFVHYRPTTLVLNNLEYDHADIFPNLDAIKTQFHHLVRTVPGNGQIVWLVDDEALSDTLNRGCWTPKVTFGKSAAAEFRVIEEPDAVGSYALCVRGAQMSIPPTLAGHHNALNAAAAVGAANQIGITPGTALTALHTFKSVKRRLECLGEAAGVTVYDDFAHHPTAISVTLKALREKVGSVPIFAVLEPRSNTMRLGVHRDALAPALAGAERAFIYAPPNLGWDVQTVGRDLGERGAIHGTIDGLIDEICASATPGTQVVVMSNGSFEGLHARLMKALGARH